MNTHFICISTRFQNQEQLLINERIKKVQLYPSAISEMHVDVSKLTNQNISNLTNCIPLLINVNTLSIVSQKNVSRIQLDFVKSLLIGLTSIQILKLQMDDSFQELAGLLQGMKSLVSLEINQSELAAQNFYQFLQEFKLISILKLDLSLSTHLTYDFIKWYKPIKQLRELSIRSGLCQQCDNVTEQLSEILTQHNNLEILMLNLYLSQFNSSSFNQFFQCLQMSTFKLQKFEIQVSMKLNEDNFESISCFLSAQNHLQSLSMSLQMMQSYSFVLGAPKQLKSLNLRFFDCQLSQITGILTQYSQLEELNLLIYDNDYCFSDLKDFGLQLTQTRLLRDLRLQFSNNISSASILGFSESVQKCRGLKYLEIQFIDKIIRMTSPSEQNTIFDSRNAIILNKGQIKYPFTQQYYNYYLTSLVLFNSFPVIEKLDLPNIELERYGILKEEITQQLENLIMKCTHLSSLRMDIEKSDLFTNMMQRIIQNNLGTLTSILLEDNLDKINLNAFVKLISIEIGKIETVSVHNILEIFPKLIILKIMNSQSDETYKNILSDSHTLINSELSYFQITNICKNDQLSNQQLVTLDCLRHRETTLLSLTVYSKLIEFELIFQKNLSHFDLWLDF